MLDFIYDSLDTVKKLKFPTVKQFAQLTGAIFGLVIIAGLYFILCDTIFSEGYKMFYANMTEGEELVLDEDDIDLDYTPVEDNVVTIENAEDAVIEETPVEAVSIEDETVEAEPAEEIVE